MPPIHRRPRHLAAVFLLLTVLLSVRPTAALDFLFTEGERLAALKTTAPGLHASILGGFDDAGAIFSRAYSNDLTVRLTVDLGPDGMGALMGAGPHVGAVPYAAVQARLPDLLPVEVPTFDVGTSLQTVDASTLWLTAAQMEALGDSVLDTPLRREQSHGFIVISLENSWDFDPSDGIASGRYDFVHVAAHEIGHSLGFVSAADGMFPGKTGVVEPSLLDLFRYRAPGIRSLAPDAAARRYFSTDGGLTSIAGFAAGTSAGGPQASHWDSIAGPVMSFAFVAGQAGEWTAQEDQVFAAIAWTPRKAQVNVGAPEPPTICFLTVLTLLLWLRQRWWWKE